MGWEVGFIINPTVRDNFGAMKMPCYCKYNIKCYQICPIKLNKAGLRTPTK